MCSEHVAKWEVASSTSSETVCYQENSASMESRFIPDGLRSPRHQIISPPHNNSAIIDTVYLPGIVTSSSSPNISFSILIDTLRRTSHL